MYKLKSKNKKTKTKTKITFWPYAHLLISYIRQGVQPRIGFTARSLAETSQYPENAHSGHMQKINKKRKNKNKKYNKNKIINKEKYNKKSDHMPTLLCRCQLAAQ